jgi:hypothetical protein
MQNKDNLYPALGTVKFNKPATVHVCIFLYSYTYYIHFTRHTQQVISIFYFTLFTSWTCENLMELQHNLATGIVIFQCSLHICQNYSSTFEQEHVLAPASAVTCRQCFAVPHHWLTVSS